MPIPSQEEIIAHLKTGVIEITFVKADGTERRMPSTLNPDLLPPRKEGAKKVSRPDDMISVWSTEDKGWRGFRYDQITRVEL